MWFFSFRKTKRNLLPLYERGAVIVEIGEQEYALVYKGEKLIQGTPNDKKVLEFYRKLKKNPRCRTILSCGIFLKTTSKFFLDKNIH